MVTTINFTSELDIIKYNTLVVATIFYTSEYSKNNAIMTFLTSYCQ